MAEGVLERVVQHGRAHVEEGLHGRPVPTHLLLLGHALGYDLVDRAFHERRLRHGFRATFYTPHPRPPRCERRALYPPEPLLARDSGASPDRTGFKYYVNEL